MMQTRDFHVRFKASSKSTETSQALFIFDDSRGFFPSDEGEKIEEKGLNKSRQEVVCAVGGVCIQGPRRV